MARYSSVLQPYSLYSKGQYGSGDIPDLRLKYFRALPTDQYRQRIDQDGNPVYGQVTLFWDVYSNLGSDIKILRSTHGPAVVHNDPYCPVVAATKTKLNIVGTTTRYNDGYTVVSLDSPHLFKSGDNITIAGSGFVDGTWAISTILNPAQFAFNHTTKSFSSQTAAGSVTINSGRDVLPAFALGERSYTDTSVVPGVEYHYSIFVEDPTPGVTDWHYGGSASIRVPKNLDSFQRLIDILPPYLTNQQFYIGGAPTVDTLRDTDYDLRTDTPPSMTKFLAGLGWVWDDVRTDLVGASRPWDPNQIPHKALPQALATVGIDSSGTLSDRALRSLLSNADTINGQRGTTLGLITLAESITNMNASIGTGYNLIPTVDDAEFYGGTGHWVASPVRADKSTSTSRAVVSSSTGYSGGDSVSGIAFISPAGPATLDTPTKGENALKIPHFEIGNPSPGLPTLHLGLGAAVSGVTPSSYTSNKVYTIETKFAHGLEIGDVVTMTSGFPLDNTSTYPAMTVTAVPTTTTVTVKLEKDISSTDSTGSGGYTDFFGSTSLWNLLSCMPGRKNAFAIANGIAVEANTAYMLSFEAILGASPTSGTVTQTAEIFYYDEYGTYVGKYSLGTLTDYQNSSVNYNDAKTTYNALGQVALTSTSWKKVTIPITTIARAKYAAIKVGPTGTSDYTLDYYFRRFMLVKGSTIYTYQSPRLISVDLSSPASSTSWGAPRTNLVVDPSFESTGTLTIATPNTVASDSTTYVTGTKSYKATVGTGSTDNRIGTRSVTLPSTGTYTASAYWTSNNSTSLNTSVQMILDGYVNGYSAYQYTPQTTTADVVQSGITPFTFCSGPQGAGTTTSSSWLSIKTEWYDQQPVLAVTLSDNADRANVIGFRSGATFPSSGADGNAGRVAVSPGNSYRVGAWARMPAVAAEVGVSISWYDTAGNFLAETLDDSTSVLIPSTNPKDYTWVSTTAAAPTTKNTNQVEIVSGTSDGYSRKITTVNGHNFVLGDSVTIATGNPNYDGTFVLSNYVSVASSGASSTFTRTITTTSAHNLAVGDTIVISFGDTNYDGTYTVATVPSTTTFTYTHPVSYSTAAVLTRTSVTGLALSSPTTFRYIASVSTSGPMSVTQYPLNTYKTATASRGVGAAVMSIYAANMTNNLCGQTMYVTCPVFSNANDPEVIAFQSTGALGSSWARAYVTFNVTNPNDLTMKVTGRSMGSSPIVGASYNTDNWMVESGYVLMSYFDGLSSTAPYYAGWNGATYDSTSTTNRSLPTSAVADFSMALSTLAVGHLKNQLPDNVAIGTPYRVTLNGRIDSTNTTVNSVDPTFTQTYVSTTY
jgi:hypothetical protein